MIGPQHAASDPAPVSVDGHQIQRSWVLRLAATPLTSTPPRAVKGNHFNSLLIIFMFLKNMIILLFLDFSRKTVKSCKNCTNCAYGRKEVTSFIWVISFTSL